MDINNISTTTIYINVQVLLFEEKNYYFFTIKMEFLFTSLNISKCIVVQHTIVKRKTITKVKVCRMI